MTAVFINPNLLFQRNDPLTTGIVYMPISLAYVAAALRQAKIPIKVIDAFAASPKQARKIEGFSVLGLSIEQILAEIPHDSKVFFLYAINLTNHHSLVEICQALKQKYPDIPVVILENTQAVTAYALKHVAHEFYKIGADYILTGEGDKRAVTLYQLLSTGASVEELKQLDGLGCPEFYNPPVGKIKDLDELPFPAWDLFPLKNYWSMSFAHGPLTEKKYMPLLTSRGCPYVCSFCVVPDTNNRKWRFRSAKNVVDEIQHYHDVYGVHEFHIEDLDPTISDDRIREICHEILNRKLDVTWKIVAGTKIETIKNEESIRLMAKAGCRYISISPETGSPELLKKMKKPFNLDHAVNLVRVMNEEGIRSQACFVLGFPEETDADRALTRNLVKDLTKKGVDEIALFIVTPVPGSSIFNKLHGYNSLSQLNFTPTWRDDYQLLSKFRLDLYKSFLFWKLRYYPFKIIRQAWNFLTRRFETKMEMVPFRAIVLRFIWGR